MVANDGSRTLDHGACHVGVQIQREHDGNVRTQYFPGAPEHMAFHIVSALGCLRPVHGN